MSESYSLGRKQMESFAARYRFKYYTIRVRIVNETGHRSSEKLKMHSILSNDG